MELPKSEPEVLKLFNGSGFAMVFIDLYRLGSSDFTRLCLTTLGGIVAIYGLFQVLDWLFSVLQSPRLAIYRHAGDESWAVVTGASDGIGRGFSEELMRRGYCVLLHGRNQAKLEKVKKELEEQWPKRKAEIVVADASKYDAAYETVVKKARALPGRVTILVNNVGGQITLPRIGPLGKAKHEDLDTFININARFATHLTAAMLPLLQENKPSLIINCGSAAGVLGVPYMTTYSGTKAYLHALTQSLHYEMLAEDTAEVDVKAFIIGNTATTGNPHSMAFFTLGARQCADSCLDRVGKSGGPVVWSHWRHALQYRLSKVLPTRFVESEMIKRMKNRLEAAEEEAKAAKKGV